MKRHPQSDGRKFLLERYAGAVVAVAVVAGLVVLPSCGGERPSVSESQASALLSGLRARPASPLGAGIAERFLLAQGRWNPTFPASSEKAPARVSLPTRSTAAVHIEDAATGTGVDVILRDARDSVGRTAEGTVVYARAHATGATLIHRPILEGTEDYLAFDTKPASSSVAYDVTLGKVSGLRLVDGTLEMLDADGAPRLRVAPPYIVGADGVTTDAALSVEGCAVDTSPAAPWGRPVTAPGASTCRVQVSWDEGSVTYPAVLDPRWMTTGSMTVARQDHTATLLSTGKVLAAGGRSTSTGTTGLASAELYDRTTGTWAATASMTGGRWSASATQLNASSNSTTSGKVLISGGINGTTSLNTAQLYSPSAGTWVAATNLNAARHLHTATLLPNGNVLVAGGMSGTTVLNTAAICNPTSGAGTWTAVATNMASARRSHTATLLASSNSSFNNKVLIVGGNSTGTTSLTSVQLFDSTALTWSSTTALPVAREGQTATTLSNGNVLITGGKSGTGTLATTLVFTIPTSGTSATWPSAGTMTSARTSHTATLLPSTLVKNGQVLVVGGSNGTSTLSSAELWNGTSTWTATTALATPVQGQTATLLSNNMVLIAGGVNGTTTVATAALYDGSFALSCTSNSQCATGFCVSGVCCDTACNGGCGACNLSGKVGTCSAVNGGTVCRGATGACDIPETCSGTSLVCPADVLKSVGTVCRSAVGACDAVETCSGTSAACPADALASAGTVCRPSAGGCDPAETCSGTSTSCPADAIASAGTVCRPSLGACDAAETCSGSSTSCPTDLFAAAGTVCTAASGTQGSEMCTGSSSVCPESGKAADVLGFESLGDWVASNAAGTVVGLNGTHTRGVESLEVAAQNYATFTSTPLTSIGNAGPLLLLDVMLPVENPPNPYWLGSIDMFVSAPSVGINNDYAGHADLTGLPHGVWETLALQLPAQDAAKLSAGGYSDLTFTIALNVPYNETGHFLFDNIRAVADVIPSLNGIATDSAGRTKAVFTYTTTATSTTIPYGEGNALLDGNGTFIVAPAEVPPRTFLAEKHAPFVATLTGSQLTWRLGSHTATATSTSAQLPVQTLGDGTRDALLPDGSKVNLDSTPPQDPTPASEPPLGAQFFGSLAGTLTVGASGAAMYTVPIVLPPGIAGMSPNLNLVYNSQGGDGIGGVGWELTGQSMIYRCPRTVLQDGYSRPVVMDELVKAAGQDTDGLCLDGQKLIESAPGSGTYSLERNDFSTIRRINNTYFLLTTKSGQYRYFGSRPTSRITLPRGSFDPVTPPTPGNETAIWPLDRVVDGWGNYYDLHYNHDNPTDALTQGVLLTEIDYTGHLDPIHAADDVPYVCPFPQSSAKDVCPFTSVKFAYENKGQWRYLRFGQSRIPRSSRLTSITTDAGTYILSYMATELFLHDRLDHITYCSTPRNGNPKTCLDPLVFDWDWSPPGWQETTDYKLPASIDEFLSDGTPNAFPGTQFADLDGDGLVDFVVSKDGVPARAWKNTGAGFSEQGSSWQLPNSLVKSNGKVNAYLADVDGDGMLDEVSNSSVYLNRFRKNQGWQSGVTFTNVSRDFSRDQGPDRVADMDGDGKADLVRFVHDDGGCGGNAGSTKLTVKLSSGTDWVEPTGGLYQRYIGDPANGGTVYKSGPFTQFANPDVWNIEPPVISRLPEDINRDGLPDIVSPVQHDINGKPGFLVWLNTGRPTSASYCELVCDPGLVAQCEQSVWLNTRFIADSGADAPPRERYVGDLDGDGLLDLITYSPKWDQYCHNVPDGCTNDGQSACETVCDPVLNHVDVKVGLSTGLGYQDENPDDPAANHIFWIKALADANSKFGTPPAQRTADQVKHRVAFADINGDGLIDMIQQNNVGVQNEISINTGTSFESLGAGSALPTLPAQDYQYNGGNGSAFVDLNGDGIADLVRSSAEGGSQPAKSWINTFRPPVIKKFPNGVAQKSVVTYAIITTADGQASAYHDTSVLDSGTTYLTAPLRVASAVDVDDGLGTGTVSTAKYVYQALRGSTTGRGPQGFHATSVSTPLGLGTILTTTTTYSQVYPYTGLPTSVARHTTVSSDVNQSTPVTLTTTNTVYCDTVEELSGVPNCSPQNGTGAGKSYPPNSPLFVYPAQVQDITHLLTGVQSTRDAFTTTEARYDMHGNVKKTTVSSQLGSSLETYINETVNTYKTAGSDEERLGKVTESVVTASRIGAPTVPTRVHTTDFEYTALNVFHLPGSITENALALTKEKVEPTAVDALRLNTAYAYDQFGNVTTTTACASDFDNCVAGAQGPVELPFRTTSVSFDPIDFNAPAGAGLTATLGYGPGRFPVKTTNAAGHRSFTAYDPIAGAIVQTTDPNGVHNCFTYDGIGTMTSETARCGTDQLVTTTMARYRTTGADPSPAALVKVTRPPNGATTWTYTDVVGRVVNTRSRAFDGGFIETIKAYNPLGLLSYESKPRVLGGPLYKTTPATDDLERVWNVTEDLGQIDDSGTAAVSVTTTDFQGATVVTTRTVHGQAQVRSETKNAIGKVVSVKAKGDETQFEYDPEGRLLSTTAPGGLVLTSNTYDSRGRKTVTTDLDSGTWQYFYNGFGDLITQIDAKEQSVQISYDVLGRMVSKTDLQGTARWVYDLAPRGDPNKHALGKLAAVVSGTDGRLNGSCTIPFLTGSAGLVAGRSYKYDKFGQLQEESECVDGQTFATSYEYDDVGRQSLVRYPAINNTQLAVGYHYTGLGFLQYLTDESSDYGILWQANAVNPLGQVTDDTMRNGVETVVTRNPATGWLRATTAIATADSDKVIQSRAYGYDEAGNLRTRSQADAVNDAASSEDFTYDELNRLLTAQTSVPTKSYNHTDTYGYDSLGNLTQKNDAIYSYGAPCKANQQTAGPHAVCTTVTSGTPYGYDANGSLTSGSGRSYTYDSQSRVAHVSSGSPSPSGSVDFIYGADGSRVVQLATSGSSTSRTLYVGLGANGKSLFERTTTGSVVENAFFIYAGSAHGGNAFSVRVLAADGTPTAARYYSFDHIGSATAVSDERGHVATVAEAGTNAGILAYDSWGVRKLPDGIAADNPSTLGDPVGRREFTGQEQVSSVGLVNLNGRIYDPILGRMLSPDPTVQLPGDLQSYNRYSYVLNNPLRYTDPTGYSIAGFDTAMNVAIGIGAIVGCIGTEGVGCAAAFGFIGALYNANSMRQAGASYSQVVGMTAIGLFAGVLGGTIGGTIGHSIIGAVIGGAVSGALGTAMSIEAYGGSLGWNVLAGAAQGAAWGAVGWLLAAPTQVSRADIEAQGGESGSWGSGAENADTVSGPPTRTAPGANLLRSQEMLGSCVAASCRNAVVLMSGDDVSEEQIRTEIQAGSKREIDWNREGTQMWRATKVLEGHSLPVKEYWPGINAPENTVDLAGVVKEGPVLVEGTGRGGGRHVMLLLRTRTDGPGAYQFNVVDPASGGSLGAQIHPTWISQQSFERFWTPGSLVIRFGFPK